MTKYTIAEITLPLNFNSGRTMNVVHVYLQDVLLTRHGGYTAVAAQGGWKSPEGILVAEPVTLYRVRVEDNEFEGSRMIELGQMLAELGQQECVMITAPSIGTVLVDREGNLS